MNDLTTISKAKLANLEERLKKLAADKSYFQLIIQLMNRMSAVPGLENTIENLLRAVGDVIGGVNLILYYRVDEDLHYADVCGIQKRLDSLDDTLVERAFATREPVEHEHPFSDTRMLTPEFSKAYTWAVPLLVGPEVIGVLKMESLHLAMRELSQQLPTFFNYAALVLKNEIESYVKQREAAKFVAIVQSSDDAIIGKTLEGVITSWNKGAERIYGYPESEGIGRSIALLAPPGHEDEAPRILARLKEGQHVEHYETVRRRKDGQDIHVSLTISPITSANGSIVGASTIARDITERIRTEDELRRVNRALRMLSASNQTLIRATEEGGLLNEICRMVVDVGGYRMAWVGLAEHDVAKTLRPVAHAGFESGYLESVNLAWADVERDRGPDGIAIRTGQPCVARDISSDPAFAPWREDALQRGCHSIIALPLTNEGQTFGALSIYAAQVDAFDAKEVDILEELAGDLAYGIVALRTRSARARAEDDIQRLNHELDQRVRERTAQLEVANKELESFSYSVSHDLRAPLRAIAGFSQALLDDYSANLDEEGKRCLHRVRAAAHRMGQLIDDMLSLSHVTRGEMRMETVDLSSLAQEIAGELARREPERKVVFSIAPEVIVTGDARFLRVALENLLGNAWKFTSKRQEATIEFGVTEQEGQPVYFVRDNGAGFDMEYADRLFGAFQRLHTPDEFPGTGIGLATVQRIIHRHGGRVWAEGRVDQGATVYFTLPKAAPG